MVLTLLLRHYQVTT